MEPILKCGHIYTRVLDAHWEPCIRRLLSYKHPKYSQIMRNDIYRQKFRYIPRDWYMQTFADKMYKASVDDVLIQAREDGVYIWDGMIQFYKNQQFLTGFLPDILEDISKSNYDSIPPDRILWPEYADIECQPLSLGDYTLRGYQKEAYKIALEKKRGILWLATNSGKTLLASAIIQSLNQPTLFLVHRKQLLDQTFEMFCEIFPQEQVGRIGDGYWEPSEITIATIQTLANHFKKSKYVYTPDSKVLPILEKTKILFFDECHQTANKRGIQMIATNCEAPYRYGLSGTPTYKGDFDSLDLIGGTGPIIAKVSNQELIELGYSAEPTIHMLDAPQHERVKENSKWQVARKYGIVQNDGRNGLIIDLLNELSQKDIPTVVLVKLIGHGKELLTLCENNHLRAVFLSGKDEVTKRKEELEKFGSKLDIIIATTIFEEGLNIKQMGALILAGGGQSERAILQSIGRVLRKNDDTDNTVRVFDFIDNGNKYLLKHSLDRLVCYQNEGFRVESNINQ